MDEDADKFVRGSLVVGSSEIDNITVKQSQFSLRSLETRSMKKQVKFWNCYFVTRRSFIQLLMIFRLSTKPCLAPFLLPFSGSVLKLSLI